MADDDEFDSRRRVRSRSSSTRCSRTQPETAVPQRPLRVAKEQGIDLDGIPNA